LGHIYPKESSLQRANERFRMNRAASIAILASSLLPLSALAMPAPFAAQERRGRGRLGVAAIALRDGRRIEQRAHERFPLASTFKLPLVMAVLARSDRGAEHLGRTVRITPADLLAAYSPVTRAHKGGTMTIAQLCAAAVSDSDNSAANLLLRTVGGPAGVTAYLRSLGDPETRLDRYEPALNTVGPNDPRDTTTPEAMANLLARLVREPVLSAASKARLYDWMRRANTGLARIRAGVPAGWTVGDKTGTTDHAGNDVAILWPHSGAPLVLAVYSAEVEASDAQRDAAIADVARGVVRQLG
jgi:beta-lactamase class A